MSRKGRQMAQRMADYVQEHTDIGKAYGGRAELVDSLSVPGEFLAAVAQEKAKVIRANNKLLKTLQQQREMSEKALTMFQRAADVDRLALAKAEQYAMPDESEISRRVAGMIQRRMAVDGTDFLVARIDDVLSSSGRN
jgi:hypothetical protein